MGQTKGQGKTELRCALRQNYALFWAVGLFSFFVNLLMLAGPLYMLNVYDRVLHSRSVETLVALTGLVVFLYGIMAVLDYIRGRVMVRVAARFQARLNRRVFNAVMQPATSFRAARPTPQGWRDLAAIERLIASPALMAVFDLPWAPLFFIGIFIFHPWLGLLALCGAAILVFAAVLNHITTRGPLRRAHVAQSAQEYLSHQILLQAEDVQALGMRRSVFDRWLTNKCVVLQAGITASDLSGSYTAMIKAFRLLLQSAMLGLGAYLVVKGQLSPGAMIAGSILLGRALAPIEAIVGQWPVVQRGRESWQNLALLLDDTPHPPVRTNLPRPEAKVSVDTVTIIPPAGSQAALRMVSLEAGAGQAIGVIGPEGAGKSTLARALTGVWPVAGGTIRLGGAALDQYGPDQLGQYIGYLPQQVRLFDGTIRDNIARMATAPDDHCVIQAAQRAGAHDMILALPDGYDTPVSTAGGGLSGGQIQRIGLARALYGAPVVLVLDEPDASLDHDGSLALIAAIRACKAAGGIVFIMAHRPAAIAECNLLLVLENGVRRAFGPRDAVLADIVVNHNQIKQGFSPAAGLG